MEIEAKFRVDQPAIFDDLLRLSVLGPFHLLATPGIEYQHNTYFDAPDRRLSTRHYSLRVRDVGKRRIGTVKRSLPTQAGIHSREEWEVELGQSDDPNDWPSSAARDQALAALAGAAVAPLMAIHTRRQYIYAVRAATVVAELSLDEGTIAAGGRTVEFRELEVELLEGQSRADLDILLHHLQARYPLIPESRGKKSRGLALLDIAGGVPLHIGLERTWTAAPHS
jgi:triphosphatase